MSAKCFVGVLETPEALQNHIEKTLEYTRKWRVTANANKCAVVTCDDDSENPVTFRWKRGKCELPIIDQYSRSYLGVEISQDCSWDANV